MLQRHSRRLCDPDVVVAMAREDMRGFMCYVKQRRAGGSGDVIPGYPYPGRPGRGEQSGKEGKRRHHNAMKQRVKF